MDIKRVCGVWNEKGFTLIEILVSMMIMSLSLVVIMGLFSGGLQSKQRAREHNIAVDLARNQMEQVLLSDTLEPGMSQGEFENQYRWKVEISGVMEEEMPESVTIIDPGILLFTVRVEIAWNSSNQEKTYTLHALHSQKK